MKSLLLKSAKIWDPRSAYHNERLDVLIKDGVITAIEKSISAKSEEIQLIETASTWISPAWFDTGAQIPDPGHEIDEDFNTARLAGLSGGFADVLVWPNSQPVRDQKTAIKYVTACNKNQVLHFHPMGALSKNIDGQHPAEIYDMFEAGSLAFSDGLQGAVSAGLLLRSLQYSLAINCVIIERPIDRDWAADAMVHEGKSAVLMGMKGQPDLVEWTIVQRDLAILEYAGGKLLFSDLSSARSIALIEAAKKNGLPVCASVNPMNLIFDEKEVVDFDPMYKVEPVLRSADDRIALLAAFANGTIDFLCSNHVPRCKEKKDREFALSSSGVNMLETTFAAVNTFTDTPLDRILNALSIAPRKFFNQPTPVIEPKSAALLTIFNPNTEQQFKADGMKSKSSNSPFIDKVLKGRVIGIVRGTSSWFSDVLS